MRTAVRTADTGGGNGQAAASGNGRGSAGCVRSGGSSDPLCAAEHRLRAVSLLSAGDEARPAAMSARPVAVQREWPHGQRQADPRPSSAPTRQMASLPAADGGANGLGVVPWLRLTESNNPGRKRRVLWPSLPPNFSVCEYHSGMKEAPASILPDSVHTLRSLSLFSPMSRSRRCGARWTAT